MTAERELGIAATKLRPPARPTRLVERTRLDVILDDGIDRGVRLVLASAPAGSRKSTVLASWALRIVNDLVGHGEPSIVVIDDYLLIDNASATWHCSPPPG